MIKISKLNKYFFKGKINQIHVINNVDLELPSKGLIALLGPSGSGKTTLLNVIGGLDKAKGKITYDDVIVDNYNVKKIDKYRKDNIGYIFQNYNLINEETVYQNLAIALDMIGITDEVEKKKRIEYTLKSVGMFKYRKKQAYALSGGQQQRVAIARALVKDAKIIIADEPTGNLDSENTIEVMNILKKISKSTLVLLVTHDINIANFYSDKIIEIKDGSIVNSYDNDNDITLARNHINHVYLKDMNLTSEKTKVGSIKFYADSTIEEEVNFEVIVRNGNYYIQSNVPLKLVEESNLKVIDDHYTDLNTTSFEEISYDNSWFRNQKKSFKESFISICKTLKKSFLLFKNSNKRAKFLHFAFGLMGMLLGASVICMINFSTPDTTPFIFADDYHILTSSDHTFYQDPIINLCENFDKQKIYNISLSDSSCKLLYERRLSYHKKINISLNLIVAQINQSVKNKIIYGKSVDGPNEVVIDMMTASDMKNAFGTNAKYEDVLGLKVKIINGGKYSYSTIVGICEGSQRAAYGNKEFYTLWCCTTNNGLFADTRYSEYEVDSSGEKLYEITSGRDVELLSPIEKNYEVIVYEKGEYYNDKELLINGRTHIVVGTYKYRDDVFEVGDEYIVNYSKNMDKFIYYNMCLNENEYVMVEGRSPQGLNECMVSIYSGFKLGSTVNGIEVVGVYNGTTRALSARYVLDYESYILNNYDYDQICFNVNGDLILSDNEVAMSLFDLQERSAQENQVSNLKIFQLLSIILIIISSIFIYLVMRSKMFSEIYNIGVYRSLGATRFKIICKTFGELLILITFTSLVGYIIILLFYNFTANSINDILGERMFKINNLYFLIGMLGVYLLNLFFGILPVFFLLRKTPSEICSKYDI